MATSRLLSGHLRRRESSFLRPLLSFSVPNPNPNPKQPYTIPSNLFAHTPFFAASSRYFSSRPADSDSLTHGINSVTESDLRSLGHTDGAHVSDAVGFLDDSILPVGAVVSLLDGYHDVTGLPWWIVIASSTLALRLALFPMIVLQLHKLKHIAEVMPKLPPPFPPLFSGKSIRHQFSHFLRENRALGAPSHLWFLASFAVQVPCFILWMASIRKMSLGHYPGFDTGGIFWFQNLTELPSGILGPVFPLMIAGLHFCNIQVAFRSASVGQATGLLGTLAQYYRRYLELLTLPILFTGFCVPQGSLVYWVTNSSLTLIQQLCLQHPVIREKFGLPDKKALQVTKDIKKDILVSQPPDAPRKPKSTSAFDLSPQQLVYHAVSYLSKGNDDRAIPLLRVALDKDPECFRALTVMGKIMVQQGLYEEAIEYLESAIYKITLNQQQPTDVEEVDFLILASLSAGVAYHQEGKVAEALVHLKRVTDMEEPEDQTAKVRYYEGLGVLAGVLASQGRKDEAAKYLRRAVEFDPQYSIYLENLEKETADDFIAPLVSSRRSDY